MLFLLSGVEVSFMSQSPVDQCGVLSVGGGAGSNSNNIDLHCGMEATAAARIYFSFVHGAIVSQRYTASERGGGGGRKGLRCFDVNASQCNLIPWAKPDGPKFSWRGIDTAQHKTRKVEGFLLNWSF